MKKLLIVDGNNIYWRAYYALINQHFTHNGKPTWGIFGSLNTITGTIRTHEITHCVVVFDMGSSDYRLNMYEGYKAGRHSGEEGIDLEEAYNQMENLQDLILKLGLVLWKEQGVEADDIIGRIAKDNQDNFDEIIILSGDKDARQLITDKVEVIHPSLGHKAEARWTYYDVVDHYGVPPERLPEIWALAGDKVDNVPGVPGIGEKTAIKLIERYGDVFKVAISDEKKIKGYSDDIALSLKLVELRPELTSFNLTDDELRIMEVKAGTLEGDMLRQTLKDFGLDSFLSRWNQGTLWTERKYLRLSDLKKSKGNSGNAVLK